MSTLYGPGPSEPAPLTQVADLAGTPVDDVNGRPAGELYGALADARHGLLRYLDIALYDSGRHVLVPIGHARFEEHVGRTRVRLQAASRDELRAIQPYDPESEPPDDSSQDALLALYGALFHGERYYAHPAYDHTKVYAGEAPIITDEMADEQLQGGPVERLSALPAYDVAQGEPDIRGWPLLARDGSPVAQVSDLVVDPEAGKVRYAVLDFPEQETDTLIPVGYVEIVPDEHAVRTPALDREDLEALPPIPPGPLTRDHELVILQTLEGRLNGGRRFDRPDFVVRSPRPKPEE